ncbi:MAG: hypothetical protein FWE95_02475 [Planctomycetaceae bacterium]|nr:hypothetical protein [Planctomycetaceae bacterium]
MPPSLLCPILSSRRTPKTKTGGVRQKSAEKRTQIKPPPPFTPEQIDATVELKLEACPKCDGELAPTDGPPKKHRQVELVAKPFIVPEYQQAQYWCEACQCHHTAKLPTEVKRAGLFGKNLIAHTAYLKGRCHKAHVSRNKAAYIAGGLGAAGVATAAGIAARNRKKAAQGKTRLCNIRGNRIFAC